MQRHSLIAIALLALAVATASAASEIGEESTPPPLPNAAWIDVRGFGALGDGVADDTAAFQAALDALGRTRQLHVPAGTYRITRTLEIPTHPVPGSFIMPERSRVVGADPDTTVLRWDGAAGGAMVWIDSMPYSSWERLTLDGRGIAGEGFRCEWRHSGPDTWMEFKDLVLRDLAYGIRATRNDHRMFAETVIRRCRFLDISAVGVETASANNQNWFICHSRFERCAVGAACAGYRELAVYESSFIGSTMADLRAVNVARGCWSKDSRMFYLGADHPIEPQITLQGNRIIDPLDPLAIDCTQGGWWMVHLIDNAIRSRSGHSGPAMALGGARVLAIGNAVTTALGIDDGDAGVISLDNSVVAREAIDAAEPPRPGTAPDMGRKVFPVISANVDNGGPGWVVQQAIDDAVAWEAAHPGSRPIVLLGNPVVLTRPLVIPAGTDIQLMGKAYIHAIDWASGSDDALIVIHGPTRVSLANLDLVCSQYRTTALVQDTRSAIRLVGCDTPGSRLLMEGCDMPSCFTFADGTVRRGLDIDRAEHLRVEAMPCFSAMTRITGGGLDARAGTYLFGSANPVSNPAYELVDGGRLVVQEAYSELFDELGPGAQRMTLSCHGAGPRPGSVTLDIYSNQASEAAQAGVVNRIAGWPGQVTQLTCSYATGRTRIDGPANGTALLSLASRWPQVDAPLPSGARVLQAAMPFATVRQGVADDGAFIRQALAQRRAARATPQPLQPVPAGASDLQFRRLQIWGGREDAIRVIGDPSATPVPLIAVARGSTPSTPTGIDHVGSVLRQAPIDLTWTIANPGSAALTLTGPILSASSNCVVATADGASASVAPGGTDDLRLTVTPGDGPWSFTWSVGTNAAGADPWTLRVVGTGAAALIEPRITSLPPAAPRPGQRWSYEVAASGMPPPTLALTGAPAWLTMSGSLISGVAPARGVFGPLTVSAANGVGLAARQSFTVSVTPAASGGGGAGDSGKCGGGGVIGCVLLLLSVAILGRLRNRAST